MMVRLGDDTAAVAAPAVDPTSLLRWVAIIGGALLIWSAWRAMK